MLAPAYLYKNELIAKLTDFTKIEQVLGSTSPAQLDFTNEHKYCTVSLNQKKEVIGFFMYTKLPIGQSQPNCYGACELKMANFSNNLFTFGRDFFKWLCEDIFHPDNDIIRLKFKCYLNNPIISTYRKYVTKCNGHITYTRNQRCEIYQIYKQDFWNFIKTNYNNIQEG